MALNLTTLASKIQIPGLSSAQILGIIQKTMHFVVLVEQLGEELKGNEKFETVVSMVEGFLVQSGIPDATIKATLTEIGWVVNLLVKTFNFFKLWPTVNGATDDPGSTATVVKS